MDLQTPLGPYQVVRLLGEGGMGAVYEAIHPAIGRRVALKLLQPGVASRPDLVARLFNEARAVNLIAHPGIVQVTDAGQTEQGAAYLVMELLRGETLSARMERVARPLPLDELLRIAYQLADTLTAAHRRGIVHRDLKPDNVMLVADPHVDGGQRVKVIDFGIAKLSQELHGDGCSAYRTAEGALLGTPVYMSPEQCRGTAEVDALSDVYSLGVMLYHLLAGQPPFSAQGVGELIGMHLYEQPAPLVTRTPEVPAALAQLVHAMLEKSPEKRPDMAAVAQALAQLGPGMAGVASGEVLPEPAPSGAGVRLRPFSTTHGTGERVRRPMPRRISYAVAAVTATLAGALLLWLKPFTGTHPIEPPRPAAASTDVLPAASDEAPDLAPAEPADPADPAAADPQATAVPDPLVQKTRPSKKKRKDIVNAQVPFVR